MIFIGGGGEAYTVSRWLSQDLNLVPLDRTGALRGPSVPTVVELRVELTS